MLFGQGDADSDYFILKRKTDCVAEGLDDAPIDESLILSAFSKKRLLHNSRVLQMILVEE